jgi:hypothetical protein
MDEKDQVVPGFYIEIIESPARRLQSALIEAGIEPEVFILRFIEIFEYAIEKGDGKVIVEDFNAKIPWWKKPFVVGRRYVFNIVNPRCEASEHF